MIIKIVRFGLGVLLVGYFSGCAPKVKISEEPLQPLFTTGDFVVLEQSPIQITQGDYDNGFASFHPSGNRILFVSQKGGNAQIYEKDLDTGEEHQIVEFSGESESPFWTPDGAGIVFCGYSSQSGDEFQRDIYFYDPNEQLVVPIVEGEGDDWWAKPADEVRFLYLKDDKGESSKPFWERNYGIYWGYLDGRASDPIPAEIAPLVSPLISPEGKIIATDRSGSLIWVDPATGVYEQMLSLAPHKVIDFDLHPNGNWVLFVSRERETYTLNIFDLSKRILQMLMTSSTPIRSPQFSPSGDKFLFSREIDGYYQVFLWRMAQ
ncbi:MAG: hypothetical protein ACK4OO_00035 [bacterium]